MKLAISQSCHLDFTSSLSNSRFLHTLLVILARARGWSCLMSDIIIPHLNGPDVVSLLRAETEPKSTIPLPQDAPLMTSEINMLSLKTWDDSSGFWPKHNDFITPASLNSSSVLLCRLNRDSLSDPKAENELLMELRVHGRDNGSKMWQDSCFFVWSADIYQERKMKKRQAMKRSKLKQDCHLVVNFQEFRNSTLTNDQISGHFNVISRESQRNPSPARGHGINQLQKLFLHL